MIENNTTSLVESNEPKKESQENDIKTNMLDEEERMYCSGGRC